MATALITGGTSGIGAAFARALAARGDNLVLVARNTERLAEMAAEITDRYGVARRDDQPPTSPSREDTVRVADRLTSTEQPIDLLVNNAGFGVRGAHYRRGHHAARARLRRDGPRRLDPGGAAGRAMREPGARARSSTSPAPPGS